MSVLFYDGVDHMIEKITTLIKGKANNSHKHGNGDITSLDAGKITSGTISIDRLPHGALERLIVVTDDTARFKLTSSNVQKGDTVKVTSTGKMYYIVDETKLSSEDGYEVYAAGTAASVPWSGVTGKPNTYTPSSHTHTKSEVGLENVDNTSDANKSVKYATSAGSANAVAWSDVNGKPAMPESGDYSSDNIEALLKKIMGLTPRMGSTCFTKDTHIENAWWNFFYIPHRDGVGGDNGDYGTLLLFPMAWDGLSYIVRAGKGGVVASISSIITSSNISSQSVDSATTVNGHTVESNVPANAKFTDTDTWRPQPDWNATSGDAVIKNKPASLPANGGNASTVNGHIVKSDVPEDAKFTDTTYTSKSAVSEGTDVSLVTTGEKATWNAKTSNVGTITGIKMNGASKGTSGVVDLGTVLTGGSQTSTSDEDGGENVYTFSDGSTITIKNGTKGDTGTGGSNRLTYYETRPTSANKASSSDRVGSIEAFVASSKMTTGKPSADAKILQMNWDNTSGWDSQLAMLNDGTLQHRSMSSGTWKKWKTVLDSSNWEKLCNMEDGDFTPNFYDYSNTKQTFDIITAYYKRVKNLCYINIYAAVTEQGKNSTTQYIDGLPFVPSDTIHPTNIPSHIVGNILINGEPCFVNVPQSHGQLKTKSAINGSLLVEGFYSI